ncbi:hypothetical protein AVEN_117395-1 [Araneus ventricosus]|uniref:Uncharacterized protein n=1 Tax=Araneus ventricosus TaxID=182803 RepID=A0A4Y2E5N8_ARAVE|nr:hypothetical protein AVEN_117395-1 [Araneus ventricosus]
MGEVISLFRAVGASSSGEGPWIRMRLLMAPVYDCPFKLVRDRYGLGEGAGSSKAVAGSKSFSVWKGIIVNIGCHIDEEDTTNSQCRLADYWTMVMDSCEKTPVIHIEMVN